MKQSYLSLIAILSLIFFVGCNHKGHFSQQYSNIAEPQTDDERTLVGEYNDYLALVDSLADIWDGKDTLTMRRLYYNQREQIRRIDKVKKYQNIRKSLLDEIERNIDNIEKEIIQKFSPQLCAELYDFYECFDLDKFFHSSIDPRNLLDGKIYVNSYGEHFFWEKDGSYNLRYKTDCYYKHPLKDNEIDWFKRQIKRRLETPPSPMYDELGITKEMVEEFVGGDTDWDATEIDWCEECANKDYLCCPKCNDGEKKDCICGCKGCHDTWEYYNL